MAAAWPVLTRQSLSTASSHCGEGPRGCLGSVGAKLVACDPCNELLVNDLLLAAAGYFLRFVVVVHCFVTMIADSSAYINHHTPMWRGALGRPVLLAASSGSVHLLVI